MAHLWTKQKQYFDLSRNKNTNIVKKKKKIKNKNIYIRGKMERNQNGRQKNLEIYLLHCVCVGPRPYM